MSDARTAERLRVFYVCHLPPVVLKVAPIPVDHELFPNARKGFETFPMVNQVSEFGQQYRLADIGGLTTDEVQEGVKRQFGHFWTSPLRLLQALEYLEGENGFTRFPDVLTFSQLVAYHEPGLVTVVRRLHGGGFERSTQENPRRWEPGTAGLFWFDSM